MVKLHTVDMTTGSTNDIVLKHPMNFSTPALDSELKNTIMEDLDNFMNGKEYYKRVGKAWKHGYSLYSLPGTGKSSLIAAMANHLKFDMYDLDSTDVQSNTDLRTQLLCMPSRSMLLIEDIDCSIKLQNRDSEVQAGHNRGDDDVRLPGLLNFIVGLW